MEKDPVCGMQVNSSQASAQRNYQGKTYYFCSPGCAAKFDQSPQRYVTSGPQGQGGSSSARS